MSILGEQCDNFSPIIQTEHQHFKLVKVTPVQTPNTDHIVLSITLTQYANKDKQIHTK